jgi:hypothetical protein
MSPAGAGSERFPELSWGSRPRLYAVAAFGGYIQEIRRLQPGLFVRTLAVAPALSCRYISENTTLNQPVEQFSRFETLKFNHPLPQAVPTPFASFFGF